MYKKTDIKDELPTDRGNYFCFCIHLGVEHERVCFWDTQKFRWSYDSSFVIANVTSWLKKIE